MKQNEKENGLFKSAKNEAAFLKLGFYGGNGSGKTYTSSLVAIGLHRHIKSKKPVFFLDSETGSDYVIPLFKKEKVDLQVAKSRAFSDLMDAIDVAEKDGSVFIIDSISHYWDELMESYRKKKGLNRLFIQHWMELKPIWREFSSRFVSSKLHIILCGRSGDVWADVADSEGVKELKKIGTKMRVEKELGYEPSLLVEMEKVITEDRPGSGWTHRAWIEKDRFDVMNFQMFDDPKFEDFLPHIELLNLGGDHRALDTERTSTEMFKNDNSSAYKYKEQERLAEEIKNEINILYPGRDDVSKNNRNLLMKELFGTHSWSRICSMNNEDLKAGLVVIEKKSLQKIESLSKSDRVETKEKEKKNDHKS